MAEKKREGYKPAKKLSEYSEDELIAVLNNCDCVDPGKLAPVCAEILKRLNRQQAFFCRDVSISHRGPLC